MKFYGELLIFILIIGVNLRVFFSKHVRRDPLVLISPITFILSIFQIFAWGIDLFVLLGVAISFLVILSNFQAVLGYFESLYVDSYSPLMKVCSILTSLLAFVSIVCLIVFAPAEKNNISLGVVEKQYKYNGSFASGMSSTEGFGKVSSILYEFSPMELAIKEAAIEDSNTSLKSETVNIVHADSNNNIDNVSVVTEIPEHKTKNVVLFIPDKRGDTFNYRPFLQSLAAEGYVVLSGDFFTKDSKWFYSMYDSKIFRRGKMVLTSLKDPDKFVEDSELYTYNIARECDELLKMIKDIYGYNCKVFVISDTMGNEAAEDFVKNNSNIVTGHLKLNDIPEYKSAGYGCVAQTDSVLRAILKLPREFKYETPKLLAERAKEVIKF